MLQECRRPKIKQRINIRCRHLGSAVKKFSRLKLNPVSVWCPVIWIGIATGRRRSIRWQKVAFFITRFP